MEEGREKDTAEGDVTRIAVSGSRTSEIETEVLSGDVDDRRVTKDAAVAGSEFTRKTMEVFTPENEAEGKVTSVDENDHNSGMEGEFVVCELVEGFAKEQKPARVKTPPQKRRAVIRVESAETQEYVSEQQGLEEIDVEEMEELSFVPSAVSEARWALHMCDNKCSREGFTFHQLAASVTEGGGAAHTIN